MLPDQYFLTRQRPTARTPYTPGNARQTILQLEEAIDGFEVGCAVLGTKQLTIGVVDEIELSGGFFDYEEKYTLKTSQIHVPARVPAEKAEEIRRTAARLGIPCSCCVYVGDHPVNDVQGSLSAGMKPVYINPFYTPVHPQGVPEIHTLTELLNLPPGQSELPE